MQTGLLALDPHQWIIALTQQYQPPVYTDGTTFSAPQVMIFSKGNPWRTLWFLCLMLPPALGSRLCAWAASTCWCLCLSPVPCSSWPPGLASRFTAASCKGSRPWDKERNTATLSMSRPYELKRAARSCTQTLLQFYNLFEKRIKQEAARMSSAWCAQIWTSTLHVAARTVGWQILQGRTQNIKKKNCLIFYIKILTYIYIEQMTKSRTNQSFWM